MLIPCSSTADYFARMKSNLTHQFYLSKIRNWYGKDSLKPDGYKKQSHYLTYLVIRNAGHTVGTEQSEALLTMLLKFTQT